MKQPQDKGWGLQSQLMQQKLDLIFWTVLQTAPGLHHMSVFCCCSNTGVSHHKSFPENQHGLWSHIIKMSGTSTSEDSSNMHFAVADCPSQHQLQHKLYHCC